MKIITAILKWLGILLLVAVAVIAATVFSFRFNDGPVGVFAGGPYRSGELVPAPDDWSFLTDRQEIDFQTLSPARSRIVWLAVHEGRLFIISGYMNTVMGKLWKQWPARLENDDRILLRVDGNLYEQRLERIMGGDIAVPILNEYNRKYNIGAVTDDSVIVSGDAWLYEVVDR